MFVGDHPIPPLINATFGAPWSLVLSIDGQGHDKRNDILHRGEEDRCTWKPPEAREATQLQKRGPPFAPGVQIFAGPALAKLSGFKSPKSASVLQCFSRCNSGRAEAEIFAGHFFTDWFHISLAAALALLCV